tara:strand:+ start:7609 stop:8415 length:807 start_codon:yes stop_codon:yes gene_type:complete
MIDKLRSGLGMIRTIKNFPLYLGDYFKLVKGKEVIYKLRNGINLKVRAGTTDREAMNEVCIYNVYGFGGFEVGEGDTVLDIGGHVGSFSILVAKRNKSGKVFVFEPDDVNFRILNENLKMNHIENVLPVKKAVSFKNGKKELFLDSNQEAHSFFSKSKNPEKISVDVISLSLFLKKEKIEKVDFLKMDCEGAEYEILYNLSDSDLEKIKKISMEYHNLNNMLVKRGLEASAPADYNGEDLTMFLRKKGFEVKVKVYGPRRGMIFAKRP